MPKAERVPETLTIRVSPETVQNIDALRKGSLIPTSRAATAGEALRRGVIVLEEEAQKRAKGRRS